MIISHYRDKDTPPQSNEEHQQGVAELASQFAAQFGMGQFGRILGLLHDKGKEQKDFQTYIRRASGMCPDLKVSNHPNHAYVGALIAQKYYKPVLPLLAYPIMCHHAGLYDYPDYEAKLKLPIPKDVTVADCGITPSLPHWSTIPKPYDFSNIIRMLFSCLVDADFLDTERYMNPEESKLRGGKKTLAELEPCLDRYLATLKAGALASPLNIIRGKIQDVCREKANCDPGFYSLTVPTGGGKTLSSLVWAFNHAITHHKQRIIIAIPFTSIIVQTAQTLRNIFGNENVLEHHSNVSFSDRADGDDDLAEKMKLATENWDYPIIVTTNVQLFESMYSNKPSHCRKLHNLCNSVLILDEVQTLPTEFLQPILNALKTYQRMFGMSVLFTTASQPELSDYTNPNNPSVKLDGIDNITELMPEDSKLYDKLRRVDIHMEQGPTTVEALASELLKHQRVLCIVNTRRDAQEIFSRLPDEGLTVHLSRMMCPRHVSQEINKVKEALKSDECPVIRVVATQLIEAGVDIDFPVVYRQEAGLDSVIQAAGRCNREGKMSIGNAYVFSLGKPLPKGYLTYTNEARKNMLSHEFDWLSPAAMKVYFRQKYARVSTFDKALIFNKDKVNCKPLLAKPRELMFSSAAKAFRLIDDSAISVIVNWGDSMALVEKLKAAGPTYGLMKELSQYTVNIYERDFKRLMQGGLVEEPYEGIYVIPDRAQYDVKSGLKLDNHWMEEILIH